MLNRTFVVSVKDFLLVVTVWSWPPNCSINSSSVIAPSSRRSPPLFSGESSLPLSYLLDCNRHHLLSCLCSLQSNNDKKCRLFIVFDVVVGGADWLICMGLVSSFYSLFLQISCTNPTLEGFTCRYIYIYRSVLVLCVLVEISLFDLIDFVSCL